MTSSISSSAMSMQRMSPLAMLQKTLASEISSGKIKSSDQDAISAALESIDESMRSGQSTGTRKAPGSPDEAKAKVESLIDDQVTSGALTSEQADELKQLFADTFQGGPGGPKGAGGPPPGPPPGAAEEDSADSDSSTLTISGSSSAIAELLQKLIEKFAETTSSTSYGTNGQSATTSQSKSLFVDISV
jgi:hypothetical protein